MKPAVKVHVAWTEEKTERLPRGISYATIAKFAEDAGTWFSEGWSIVLEFPPGSALARSFEAHVRFLMPGAPWGRLRAGCVFGLYEGDARSAVVTVL
jgi:hypothetical protein